MILENIQRILIIKLRAIGDVLLSTPVAGNIKKHFPDSRIDFLVESFAADVIRGNPWVSNVVTFDRRKDSSIGLLQRVRKGEYDLVIDLFCNPRSAAITKFSGARYRAGFPFRFRRYAYNLEIPPRSNEVHNIDFNLDALRHLGIPIEDSAPFFPVRNEAKQFAREWFETNGIEKEKIIGLNPGGGWYTKKWGTDHFAVLGDALAQKYNAAIMIVWGPGEEQDAINIRKKMKQPALIAPLTNLQELGALLQDCLFVVSNDSGPMHIAAALGVPTLGIFGPTSPRLQGPFGEQSSWVRNEGLECLECNLTKCSIGNICMTQLDVHRVVSACEILLRKRSSSQPSIPHSAVL
jgi:lipopolysaccharide heptosyltransferase II